MVGKVMSQQPRSLHLAHLLSVVLAQHRHLAERDQPRTASGSGRLVDKTSDVEVTFSIGKRCMLYCFVFLDRD